MHHTCFKENRRLEVSFGREEKLTRDQRENAVDLKEFFGGVHRMHICVKKQNLVSGGTPSSEMHSTAAACQITEIGLSVSDLTNQLSCLHQQKT